MKCGETYPGEVNQNAQQDRTGGGDVNQKEGKINWKWWGSRRNLEG